MAENITTNVRKIDNKDELMFVKQEDCYTGYKSSLLIDDIPSYLKSFVICAHCEGIMRNPCGIGNPQILVCSNCTSGDEGNPLSPTRNVASELKAKCPLEKRGCDWQGLLAEIDGHLEDCQHYFIECLNQCGCIVKREEMGEHLKKECSSRQVCCEFCSELYSFGDDNLHLSECWEANVECPLACGVKVLRREIKEHVEELCCNTNVGCPFKCHGCCEDVEVLRKHVESHCNEFRLKHLEMKMEFVLEENQLLRTKSNFQEEIINNLVYLVSDPAPVYYFVCQSSYDSSHCWTLNGLSLIDSEWTCGPTFKYQSHTFRLQYYLKNSCIILGVSVTLQYTNYFSIKFCTFVMCHGLKKTISHYDFIAEYYPENKHQSVVKNYFHSAKQIVKNIANIPISLLREKHVNNEDSIELEIFFKC